MADKVPFGALRLQVWDDDLGGQKEDENASHLPPNPSARLRERTQLPCPSDSCVQPSEPYRHKEQTRSPTSGSLGLDRGKGLSKEPRSCGMTPSPEGWRASRRRASGAPWEQRVFCVGSTCLPTGPGGPSREGPFPSAWRQACPQLTVIQESTGGCWKEADPGTV